MLKKKKKRKELFWPLFKKNHGHIEKTCIAFGISRTTFYRWLDKDQKFKDKYIEVCEADIDDAELSHKWLRMGIPIYDEDNPDQIIGWIEKPDIRALSEFLEKKAKNRGWAKDNTIKVDGSLNISWNETKTYDTNEEADQGA